MRLAGGIDEAGYGPKLGPMTVGAFGVLLDSDDLAPLHRLFAEDFPVPVRDSKLLFVPRAGIRRIERSALVLMGSCWGEVPETVRGLLQRLCGDDVADVLSLPWYAEVADEPLPLAADRSAVEDLGAAAKEAAQRSGVSFTMAAAKVFTERRLNSIWGRAPNKQAASLKALEALVPPFCSECEAVVVVDQQGGRRNYAGWLAGIFGRTLLQKRPTENGISYEVPEKGITLRFEPSADERHPTVAAASIIAKYARELLMGSFYEFWRRRGVEPTDGYGGRHHSFLKSAAPVLDGIGCGMSDLLRTH